MASAALEQPQNECPPQNPTHSNTPGAVNPTSAIAALAAGFLSSPVKSVDVVTNHYKDIEASSVAEDMKVDPRFLQNHLSSPSPDVDWENNGLEQESINTIRDAGTHSDILYTPLMALLNNYSGRIHGSFLTCSSMNHAHSHHPSAALAVAGRPDYPLAFLDHHQHPLVAHPEDNKEKPDLVVVPGLVTGYTPVAGTTHYSNILYHRVFSIVECKPIGGNGAAQTARYCFRLMLARPDMPGLYGLWARPQGYQVIWSDASGAIASLETPWDDLNLLRAYVYSLYCPPATHFLRDPYVHTPRLLPETASKGACWTIECPNHTYHYSDCETLIIGDPWNRRTQVWKHTDEEGTVVIKDSYRDNERRFKEEALLDKIHGDTGIYPGVVRKLHGGSVPDITTARRATSKLTPERTKARLVMGSFGEELCKAETVREILMVVYDVLESMHTSV